MRILTCLAIFLATFCILLVQSEAAEDGPVAHWAFGEGNGDTAGNSGVDGVDGEIEGASWVNDPLRGWALEFDGADDRVNVDTDIYHFDAPFSITVWIKTASRDSGILCKATTGDGWNNGEKMLIVVNSSDWAAGQGAQLGNVSMGGHSCSGSAAGAVDDDEWHHIAFSWDGTAGGTFYIDGVEPAPDMDTYGPPPDRPGDTIYIGYVENGEKWFSGLIDDVRIYDRPLEEDEVIQIMGEGEAVDPAGKLAVTWGMIRDFRFLIFDF